MYLLDLFALQVSVHKYRYKPVAGEQLIVHLHCRMLIREFDDNANLLRPKVCIDYRTHIEQRLQRIVRLQLRADKRLASLEPIGIVFVFASKLLLSFTGV